MTDNTLLHRQVHQSWVQDGRVTSLAFRPTPKDQRKLSVYDGDQISAAKAWEHFTSVLHLSSVGVLAVSNGECRSLSLSVEPDPKEFQEHVLIDFSSRRTEKEVVRVSKQLRSLADVRGWQYVPRKVEFTQ